jgi:catechol 2,3-dioxygenase-like lactoylglutathione lyase family enzyme
MIKNIAFATVWVLDQDRAKDFYVNTLGFEVRSDERVGSFRWLTVAPHGQDVAFVLMPIAPNPMMDEVTVTALAGWSRRASWARRIAHR